MPFGPKKLTYVFFAELVEGLDELLVGVLQDEAHLRLHGGEEQGELLQRAGDNHLIVGQRRSYTTFFNSQRFIPKGQKWRVHCKKM